MPNFPTEIFKDDLVGCSSIEMLDLAICLNQMVTSMFLFSAILFN